MHQVTATCMKNALHKHRISFMGIPTCTLGLLDAWPVLEIDKSRMRPILSQPSSIQTPSCNIEGKLKRGRWFLLNQISGPKLLRSQPIGFSSQHPCTGISIPCVLDRMLAWVTRFGAVRASREMMANRPATMAVLGMKSTYPDLGYRTLLWRP